MRRPKLTKLRECERSKDRKIPFFYCRNCGVSLLGKPNQDNNGMCYFCGGQFAKGVLYEHEGTLKVR